MSKKAASVTYEEVLLQDLKDPEEAAPTCKRRSKTTSPPCSCWRYARSRRPRGMANVARKAHVGRESLYKTLSEKRQSRTAHHQPAAACDGVVVVGDGGVRVQASWLNVLQILLVFAFATARIAKITPIHFFL